jgi:hypothetical protein
LIIERPFTLKGYGPRYWDLYPNTAEPKFGP